jgi:hypothetical protein
MNQEQSLQGFLERYRGTTAAPALANVPSGSPATETPSVTAPSTPPALADQSTPSTEVFDSLAVPAVDRKSKARIGSLHRPSVVKKTPPQPQIEESPPRDEPLVLGAPGRQLQHSLTIPEFSSAISSFALDRVLGIPGLTPEITELFLRAGFPEQFTASKAKELTARINQRLAITLLPSELHTHHQRALPQPHIKVDVPQAARLRILHLSGSAPGATSIALISAAIAVRIPITENKTFSGIFPLRGDPAAPVSVYSLNSLLRTRSQIASLTFLPHPIQQGEAPAFDVLSVLDRVSSAWQEGGPTSQANVVESLKGLASTELKLIRELKIPFVMVHERLSRSQALLCEGLGR